ncbi:hypothetical protein GS429_01430 [Natronorubrum sp. JWXQ-INN-674]|uniref:Uncharacterized protein n=1 Tax=Natronorubrum halalkaliphilum TaxID=2691917 RepID=A0A6B0VH57_9EURY|nr:hypothetical protein [Natronorubrum halalkaliphilum]MXV60753.1 hypothetical protein [Natronorubrum halalkaliphilum]
MKRRTILASVGSAIAALGGSALYLTSPSNVRNRKARISYEYLNDYVPQILAVCSPSEDGYVGVLDMAVEDATKQFEDNGFKEFYFSYLQAYERDDQIVYEQGNLIRLSEDGDKQLHVRLFPRGGQTEVRAHWEPSAKHNPVEHIDGDDVNHSKGESMIREEFDIIDKPFSGNLSMDDRC